MNHAIEPRDEGFRPGTPRSVIEAALVADEEGERATLAVVLETEGSTYVASGAIALFRPASGQTGWLSGGCLEPEIAKRASRAAQLGCIEWMEIDTRDDEALFTGSAVGCRGQLRLALLPLHAMPGWDEFGQAWLDGLGDWRIAVSATGPVAFSLGDRAHHYDLPRAATPWATSLSTDWTATIRAIPRVVLFGAGPETALLIPLLCDMGWKVDAVEHRPRWQGLAELADNVVNQSPSVAVTSLGKRAFHAALVMHHNFELDLEALMGLADSSIPFIGLLGPQRRREDLFALLTPHQRENLSARLRSPVGLNLGGRGPEAIALSIAAQLHAYIHQS
jgi:xanthine dehydrogenase accessory factor